MQGALAGMQHDAGVFRLDAAKKDLLRVVSASLIAEPRFHDPSDATRKLLIDLLDRVAPYDAQFVLKIALYCRQDLGIRSTANFLLAYASVNKECTPFLRKYYAASVRLPSDWLNVAELVSTMPGQAGRMIPSALRRAMLDRFGMFDEYQLAKYNHDGAIKKRRAKAKKANENDADDANDDEINNNNNGKRGKAQKQKPGKPGRPASPSKPAFTLKQMIRQLHVAQPAVFVMALLGKRYPGSAGEFARTGLPGEWDPERAGQRMKLAVPETWETFLSARGNKAPTWQALIDRNKLPFMAMLRNLRNLILAGLNRKYHEWAQGKLRNPHAVTSSRQFPMRFFTAYDVLDALIKDVSPPDPADKASRRKPSRLQRTQERRVKEQRRSGTRVTKPVIDADGVVALCHEYKVALDAAIRTATVSNVKPIRGRTIVLCDVSDGMKGRARGGPGAGLNQHRQLAMLLGLMCKYVCEECDMYIVAGATKPVALAPGTILDNVRVLESAASSMSGDFVFPNDLVVDAIRDACQIDTILVLSSSVLDATGSVGALLRKYRALVNADLLFVSVDLSAQGRRVLSSRTPGMGSVNDVSIAGFTESILTFIAERGDASQLAYVEHIDRAKGIDDIRVPFRDLMHRSANWATCALPGCGLRVPAHQLLQHQTGCACRSVVCPVPGCYADVQAFQLPMHLQRQHQNALGAATAVKTPPPPVWTDVRLFVSSTFSDMHEERNHLALHVWPELQRRCEQHCIRFAPVDLRWGIPDRDYHVAVTVCLREVLQCAPFFIGILGDRYGFVPDAYNVPLSEPALRWLQDIPAGLSVTELEVHAGALRRSDARAAFFIRQRSDADAEPDERVERLKDQVAASDYPVVSYHKQDLEEFGQNVLQQVWQQMCAEFPALAKKRTSAAATTAAGDDSLDELAAHRALHQAVEAEGAAVVAGRERVLERLRSFVESDLPSPLLLHGRAGDGKTATLAALAATYRADQPSVLVLSHYVGASPGSTSARVTLHRVCSELARQLGINEPVPSGYQELRLAFPRFLDHAAHGNRVLLLLDALDSLEDGAQLDWLPAALPVRVVVTATTDSVPHRVLAAREDAPAMQLPPLDYIGRKAVVTAMLRPFGKRLDDSALNNQMRLLVSKKDADRPLYLRLACQYLMERGSFETLTACITDLPLSLPLLLDETLDRIVARFPSMDVPRCLSALVCARAGVRRHDLPRLLVREDAQPVLDGYLAALLHALAPFLSSARYGVHGDVLIRLSSAQMAGAVTRRYLAYATSIADTHAVLADVYEVYQGDAFATMQLPYHAWHARRTRRVEDLLTSLAFIQGKCSIGGVHDLLQDYAMVVGQQGDHERAGQAREQDTSTARVRAYGEFVRRQQHVLAAQPWLVYQQAANEPASVIPAQESADAAPEAVPQAWMRHTNKPTSVSACVMTWSGFADPVMGCAFSPDGSQVLMASSDHSIKVYDTRSGAELAQLVGHGNLVQGAVFSPDGRVVASASWDTTVRLWSRERAAQHAVCRGHHRRVVAIAFAPDSKTLASGAWDGSVRLWDVADGRQVHAFHAAPPMNAVAFAPNGKFVVSGAWDGTLMVWDVLARKRFRTIRAHAGSSVRAVCVLPDNKQVVSAAMNGALCIHSVQTGALVSTLVRGRGTINSIDVSPDARFLVTASDDWSVRLWRAEVGRHVGTYLAAPVYVNRVRYSPDGELVAVALHDGTARVYRVESRDAVALVSGHTGSVTDCVLAGKKGSTYTLVTGSEDRTVRVWHVPATPEPDSGSEHGVVITEAVRVLAGHFAAVTTLAVHQDTVASASDDLSVRLWRLSTGACVSELRQHTNLVKAVAFSPDGKRLVTGARDCDLVLWDLASESVITVARSHRDWVNDVAWSPDGKWILSGGWDFDVRLLDASTLRMKRLLPGHRGAVSSVAWSPDSKTVISSSFDGTVKAWSAINGSVLTTLRGHTSRINSCAFSPLSATTAVSASDDGHVKLWDVFRGEFLSTLSGHTAAVNAVAFNPTPDDDAASELVSASDDCSVRLWRPSDHLATAGSADTGCGSSAAHSSGIVCITTASVRGSSSGGQALASLDRNGVLKAWHLDQDGGEVRELAQRNEEATRPVCMAMDAQSGNGFLGTATGVVVPFRVVSEDSDARGGSSGLTRISLAQRGSVLRSHGKVVSALAASDDVVASGGWDGGVNVYSGGSGGTGLSHCVSLTMSGLEWVTQLATARAAGQVHVIAGAFDGSVCVWDAGSSRRVPIFTSRKLHESSVLGIATQPNTAGLTVASSDADGAVKLWDSRSGVYGSIGAGIGDAPRHLYIPGAAKSPAATWLSETELVTAHDTVVRVWDVRASRVRAQFLTAAPCTALLAVGAARVLAGDSLGSLYVLDLITGSAAVSTAAPVDPRPASDVDNDDSSYEWVEEWVEDADDVEDASD